MEKPYVSAFSNPKYIQRSSQPAADWSALYKVVKEALDLHMQIEGPPPNSNIVLVEDYPKKRIGEFDTTFDVILQKLISSERSEMARNIVPKGPTTRESRPHPDKEGYKLITIGWWEEVIIGFTILAKSNARANEIVDWFHRFMMFYIHALKFFESRGIEYMVFDRRLEDGKTQDFGQELYTRRIHYKARLELLNSYEAKNLDWVTIKVGGKPEYKFYRPPDIKIG